MPGPFRVSHRPPTALAPWFEVEPAAAEWQTFAGAKAPGEHEGVPCPPQEQWSQPWAAPHVV
jgi:hypothetical protein